MTEPPEADLRQDLGNAGSVSGGLARFMVRLQYLLPQHAVSRLTYHATRWRCRPWKNLLINWFIRRYGVDMSEAARPTAGDYTHFNDFFTRELRVDARPLADAGQAILCPVDGSVSEIGIVDRGRLLQVKGHDYSAAELLSDPALAARFERGPFATIYLAPRNYHRIHMPCAGKLLRMIHVPGRRFAVNKSSVAAIPRLFARNERLVTVFDTEFGPLAVVMVGALCVGSMQTVWADAVAAAGRGVPHDYQYAHLDLRFDRGDEIGRFNMGSTVILLLPAGTVRWRDLRAGAVVRMGEILGVA